MNNGSFIYLFQKFDEIYQQETFKLKSVITDNKGSLASESSEEKEAKKTIKELLRCEIAISDLVSKDKISDETPYELALLLEVLYGDFDLLPEILLSIFLKISKCPKEKRRQFHTNVLNFMTPYLELLNEQQWNVSNIWEKKNHSKYLEDVFQENKEFLNSSLNISEDIIDDFVQRLEQNKNNYEELRKILSELCSDKAMFKEEAIYYQMLGRASLILELKSLDERKKKLSINFLKISIISHLCSGK